MRRAARSRRLNSPAARREFERRYGKKRGDRIYGATLERVAEEQAARNPSGVKIEHVRTHYSRRGRRRFRVRGHPERIRARRSSWHAPHPHRRGEHPGVCSGPCRQGKMAHPAYPGRRRHR